MWALFAYLGGIVCAFSTMGFTFIVPFAKVSYQFEAILTLFRVQLDTKTVKEIGIKQPEILEILVKGYDKSKSEHRMLIKQYLY